MENIELHQKHFAEIFDMLLDDNDVKLLKTTFSTAPEKLDTAEIPAQYTLTGSGNETNQFGESEEFITRIYRVQVAVLPTGQATPTARETLCRELLEKCRKHLKRYPLLNQCERVYRMRVLSDSGVVILPEFGQKYVGFEIRAEVQYADVINFAEQE